MIGHLTLLALGLLVVGACRSERRPPPPLPPPIAVPAPACVLDAAAGLVTCTSTIDLAQDPGRLYEVAGIAVHTATGRRTIAGPVLVPKGGPP